MNGHHDFSKYKGKVYGTEVTEQELKQFYHADEIRVLDPNSPMTMDLRHERLNVFIDESGKITELNFG